LRTFPPGQSPTGKLIRCVPEPLRSGPIRDCCADPDAEVHAMLLDIVIAKQAVVVATAELAGALPGSADRSRDL
jgi:hypothetical protein